MMCLQVLKMSYNRVKEINKDTFQGLEGLVRLHMDHNRIEFINPEAFYGLTMLQLVHLEGNLLQQLHPDTFITLRHSQVFKVSSVRNIHLSDNFLASLPKDVFTGCSQLENVYLHGNPWSCDCRMAWFPEWAERNSGKDIVHFSLQHSECFTKLSRPPVLLTVTVHKKWIISWNKPGKTRVHLVESLHA